MQKKKKKRWVLQSLPTVTDIFQRTDNHALKKCPENNPELEFQINTGAIFGVLTPIVKF